MIFNLALIGVGFEPTPPKRLVPKTSALDRSAIQPKIPCRRLWHTEHVLPKRKGKKGFFPVRELNPGLAGESRLS